MSNQVKRVGLAGLIVMCAIAFPAASTVLFKQQAQDDPSVSLPAKQELSHYYEGENSIAQLLFERLEGKHSEGAVPASFCDEVIQPDAWGVYQSYCSEGVVGLLWQAAKTRNEESLLRELEQHGWQRIGLTENSTSFVKDHGQYRWIHVQVLEAGGYISAVFYYRKDS